MQDAPGGSQDAPTVAYGLREAATLLGVGVNTLRRRIAAGQVRAERVERAQGFVWRVYLDGRHPPNDPPGDAPIREAPGRVPHPPTALMQAEAMAAYTRSLLEPLVAHVAELAGTIRDQAETIGALRAELEALKASHSPVASNLAVEIPDVPPAPSGFWRRLRAAMAVVYGW